MKTFYLVLSNLNHNGETKKAGTIFEGESGQFTNLVSDGVLRVVEGASSLSHAAEIVAAEAVKPEAEPVEEAAKPQDTWGPRPDPVVPASEPAGDAEDKETAETSQEDTNVPQGTSAEADKSPEASAPGKDSDSADNL